jgi:hypothetical protein
MPGLLLVMTGKLVEEGDGTSARTTVEPYGFVGVRGILLRCEPDEKEVLATWEMSSRCRLARTSPLIRVSPYRGLHVRCESVCVVPRSRAILCRPKHHRSDSPKINNCVCRPPPSARFDATRPEAAFP